MGIEFIHNRMVVGLRKEEWTKVYYEPVEIPEDITTPNLAPEAALFSHSRGEATENEPMFGETGWEPLLNHEYFPSGVKAERLQLQRKILFDAWRYLMAQEPAQIAVIKEQLQGSHRQRKLLGELDKARKARSNRAKQKVRRRAARRVHLLAQGLPVESTEKSDDGDEDDSGLGSGTDDDDDDADRMRMPPPSQTAPRRPSRLHSTPFTGLDPLMSGGRESTIDEESDTDNPEVGRRSGSTARSLSQKSASAAAKRGKRKQSPDPELQRSSRPRTGEGLFVTPLPHGRPSGSKRNVEDDDELDVLAEQDANDGFDFDAALMEAARRSLVPDEDGSMWNENGGLHPDDAERAAMRNSTAPEGGIDI